MCVGFEKAWRGFFLSEEDFLECKKEIFHSAIETDYELIEPFTLRPWKAREKDEFLQKKSFFSEKYKHCSLQLTEFISKSEIKTSRNIHKS